MKITPKVSVLIPSYNYGFYLPEAIESIINQSFKDWELIIVDNCSSDNTAEIVNNYILQDDRIKLYNNDENVGMYRNYNQALLYAKGKYIKFLNADDKLHQDNLKVFVNILDSNNNISLVTSNRQYFGEKEDVLSSGYTGLHSGKDIILEALKRGNFIGEPTTVMFRQENLNLGLFDSSLLMFADLDMWLRHLSIGDIYFVDEVLSFFRIHEKQGTAYLNEKIDKSIFNRLQWEEYIHYALVINKYFYDYSVENYKEVKNLLDKRYYKNHKLLFVDTIHNQKVRYLLQKINLFYYLRYFFSRKK